MYYSQGGPQKGHGRLQPYWLYPFHVYCAVIRTDSSANPFFGRQTLRK